MSSLIHQRCIHHFAREAVARCPECRQFYCRECITEHDDRVICSACLKKLAVPPVADHISLAWLLPAVQLSIGFCIAWMFFYFLGATLLSIPSQYHEGTVWIDKWWKGQ